MAGVSHCTFTCTHYMQGSTSDLCLDITLNLLVRLELQIQVESLRVLRSARARLPGWALLTRQDEVKLL